MRLMHLNELRYQRKPLWLLLLRRWGGAETTIKDTVLEKSPRKDKSKATRKFKNDAIRMQMIHNLVLNHAI
jgi:hypothetical protein